MPVDLLNNIGVLHLERGEFEVRTALYFTKILLQKNFLHLLENLCSFHLMELCIIFYFSFPELACIV